MDKIREGVLKEIFDALEDAFRATGIDYYLIGAQARDIWYSRDNKVARQTNDVDFAVQVGSAEEYRALRSYLKEHKAYRETKSSSFVMLTPEGAEVDILPFGELEIDNSVILAGEGLHNIKVNGFMEVYRSGTEEVTMPTGHHFKIATLPAIVMLKLISYDDRPEVRLKDPLDIASIIEQYFDLQANHIYDSHADIFVDGALNLEESKLDEISAIVIGREIRKIAGTNPALLNRLQSMLQKHIALREYSAFIRGMVAGTDETVNYKTLLLERMYGGLDAEN